MIRHSRRGREKELRSSRTACTVLRPMPGGSCKLMAKTSKVARREICLVRSLLKVSWKCISILGQIVRFNGIASADEH